MEGCVTDGGYVERSLRDASGRGRTGYEIVHLRPFGPIVAKKPAPNPPGAAAFWLQALGGRPGRKTGVEKDIAVEVGRGRLRILDGGADLRPARGEQQQSRQRHEKNEYAQYAFSAAFHVNSSGCGLQVSTNRRILRHLISTS